MLTRRQLLKAGVLAGVATGLPIRWRGGPSTVIAADGVLDAHDIPKYVSSLIVPPAMPLTSVLTERGRAVDFYEIAMRQFRQQILPAGLPDTTVWSYGSVRHPATFNYPAFTIEARADVPVRARWINDLVDGKGNYLPHLLPVDQTLHWANPAGGPKGRDSRPVFGATPGPYTGPVPIVTHLHGGHTSDESDGYTEAWYLPRARNIPDDFARVGSHYQSFRSKFQRLHGQAWTTGDAVFQYDNDQPASTLWYHDHALGMTRLNVYAGPAGFYLLRGGAFDTEPGQLPAGPYEIPLAIQDRTFNVDGSLFYPDSRASFDEFEGPYVPETDVPPMWNPEFFGTAMLVNGRTWPSLDVEPRRYRFRVLNGCNGRFLMLKLVTADPAARPTVSALPFTQIGGDGGFLPVPVEAGQLLLGPAERADVVVDFSGLPTGTSVYLTNDGPDEPFGGGEPGEDFDWPDPATTGQVMRFRVVSVTGTDASEVPSVLPAPPKPPAETVVRRVSLNEAMSMHPGFDGPIAAMLGTVNPNGTGHAEEWDHPITETVAIDTVEVWEIHNFTADAHPIHIHEVQFEVVDRAPFDGPARPPEATESGLKDTVIAYPGEVTRVRALFDRAGLYVWHCHILEHEDNEMMRPYRIG